MNTPSTQESTPPTLEERQAICEAYTRRLASESGRPADDIRGLVWLIYFGNNTFGFQRLRANFYEAICREGNAPLDDSAAVSPSTQFRDTERRELYRAVRAALTRPERLVLRLRLRDKTLAQIGDWLAQSKENIRLVQDRALARLRRHYHTGAAAPGETP